METSIKGNALTAESRRKLFNSAPNLASFSAPLESKGFAEFFITKHFKRLTWVSRLSWLKEAVFRGIYSELVELLTKRRAI